MGRRILFAVPPMFLAYIPAKHSKYGNGIQPCRITCPFYRTGSFDNNSHQPLSL
ncbi:hypothetical protein NBRC111893_1434 [Lentilactobacillus kosonis]|uniref:Uncharacterized protein n=1 Tax=Lentilactobacillus kosonis TaxID=2810561 RepID=A0A401FM01_9LACO|nr:hypothetical protein NBRC111893_1434 [Lentilactobacillus kosonis]